MEATSVVVKARKVGNSIALFLPAEICQAMEIKQDSEIMAHIHKKKHKDTKKLASLYGALKGKNPHWSCKEDRLDVWGI